MRDSFGLVRAKGGMADFPLAFSTGAPNKFCDPPGGLTDDQKSIIRQRMARVLSSGLQNSGIPRFRFLIHMAVIKDQGPC